MKIRSIQARVGIYIAACSLVISIILVSYSLYSSSQTQSMVRQKSNEVLLDLVEHDLLAEARAGANEVKDRADAALSAARALAVSFASIKKQQDTTGFVGDDMRDLLNATLKGALNDHPSYLGMYTAWEPNRLDGNDDRFRNAPGHDATGRFIPYWSRDGGRLEVVPLEGYEDTSRLENGDRAGEYYLCPKETQQTCVLNPYRYTVQGEETLLTSVVAPIMVNGEFHGMTGADISVSFLNDLAESISQGLYDGQNEVIIISQNGHVAGHSAGEDVGKPLRALYAGALKKARKSVSKDRALVDMGDSEIKAFAPIRLGKTGTEWTLMIVVPKSVVLADVKALDAAIAASIKADRNWQVIIAVLVTLGAIGVTWFLSGSIVRPIRQAEAMLQRVADGDMTPRLKVATHDETGKLASACNTFLDKTQPVIAEVVDSSSSLSAAAEEASVIAQQTRKGVVQQQDEIQQLATASNEMAATAQNVSENAAQAAEATSESQSAANDGRQVIEQMANVIRELASEVEGAAEVIKKLEADSRNIHSILDVIQDVTEQTNLLALNAAIEAARAGEHGRGFAVVADEVRSLAQRTHQSTGEIQQMIENLQAGSQQAVQVMESGQKKAEAGVEQAGQAGVALDKILTAVDQINELNVQVASAAEQQSAVADDINKSISNINQVAEEAAGGANQSAESSNELAKISVRLNDLVKQFKV